MPRFKIILMLLSAVAVAVSACNFEPATYQDGEAAYQRGDFYTAFRLYKSFAEQGDARAQAKLGLMYDRGQGVERDHEESNKWYLNAAKQGNADAQYYIGTAYENAKIGPYVDGLIPGNVRICCGYAVRSDYEEATKWYQLAAAQGHTLANNALQSLAPRLRDEREEWTSDEALEIIRKTGAWSFGVSYPNGPYFDASRGIEIKSFNERQTINLEGCTLIVDLEHLAMGDNDLFRRYIPLQKIDRVDAGGSVRGVMTANGSLIKFLSKAQQIKAETFAEDKKTIRGSVTQTSAEVTIQASSNQAILRTLSAIERLRKLCS
jgi:hypothetical protein